MMTNPYVCYFHCRLYCHLFQSTVNFISERECAKIYQVNYICFGCTSTYFSGFVRIYSRILFPSAALLWGLRVYSNGLWKWLNFDSVTNINQDTVSQNKDGSERCIWLYPIETTVFLAPLTRRQEYSLANGLTTIYLSEPHKRRTFIT